MATTEAPSILGTLREQPDVLFALREEWYAEHEALDAAMRADTAGPHLDSGDTRRTSDSTR